jgi:CBS domain containing-hemolysin-like protein
VQLMRPVSIVPESKPVDALLREMRDERSPLRVVVDEYGGSVGIVTLEDLLEEILGDIEDERDRTLPGMRQLSPREWRVPARVDVEDFTSHTGVDLPEGDYETVAGMLLSELGRIPTVGEKVKVGELLFHVDAASDRAILTVRVTVPESVRS